MKVLAKFWCLSDSTGNSHVLRSFYMNICDLYSCMLFRIGL